MEIKKTKTPEDVKLIIKYTKLRKKYPEIDSNLRKQFGFSKDSITYCQMFNLLNKLEMEKQNGR